MLSPGNPCQIPPLFQQLSVVTCCLALSIQSTDFTIKMPRTFPFLAVQGVKVTSANIPLLTHMGEWTISK
jgi:hypothetical protein